MSLPSLSRVAVLVAAWTAGCGASPPPDEQVRPHPIAERAEAPPPAAPEPPDCASRPLDACPPAEGCIPDRATQRCRAATNACERLVPEPTTPGADPCHHIDASCMAGPYRDHCRPLQCEGAPPSLCTRDRGCVRASRNGPCRAIADPCEANAPVFGGPQVSCPAGCGFNQTTLLCQTHTDVACPATAAEAQSLDVSCGVQRGLRCDYPADQIAFACALPPRCSGGAAPPPDRAWQWQAFPDYDAQGCPLTPRALEARCRPVAERQCSTCAAVHRCVRGRWRSTRLPPRP